MQTPSTNPFSVNGRTYNPPARPIAVLCLDGSADEYIDAAMTRGLMPNFQRMSLEGYRGMARGALPSFTNVNNTSIVTGVPPSVHGIGGNFFFDSSSGQEVMMNSASYLRSETILAAAAHAGRRVGIVTAKEKLRDILSHKVQGIAFSSEKASQAKRETHGIDNVEEVVGEKMPPIYSGAASIFVLKAGAALIEKGLADFLYLSLTDYMQHKYAPEAPEVIEFYADIDACVGHLLKLGAIVGATADHGMNAKQTADGQPNVIYLETLLAKELGKQVRVILPITDPYVVHHGALGSFAVVHLPNPDLAPKVAQWLMQMDEITEVYDRRTAALKLELPEDRIGDLVVMSRRDVVIGRTPEYHDLSKVAEGLRSHGGRYEEMVPLFISESLSKPYLAKAQADPRNFDIFDFTINGTRR